MSRNDEVLEVTLRELRAAGYCDPVVMCGKHLKIKCSGLPPIMVSRSSSDVYAVNQARRTVRRIIAQNRR